MKKKHKILSLLCIIIILSLNSIVNADTGPKPSINIKLKNMETDNYLIDLLVEYKPEHIDSSYGRILEEEYLEMYEKYSAQEKGIEIKDGAFIYFNKIAKDRRYNRRTSRIFI